MHRNMSRRKFLLGSAAALASTPLFAGYQTQRNSVESDSERLASAMHGQFIRSTDVEYGNARRVWNAAVEKRPRFIAKCLNVSDVQRCLEFAVQHDVPISIRGGGHHPAGTSLVDTGLVLDFSRMTEARVDPPTQRLLVQP